VVSFQLITGHGCLVAHLHRLSICPSLMCILCKEENSIMNHDHLRKCTTLNFGNASSVMKLCWDVRRQMESLHVPEH
jgi:hypothetical protein